MSLLKSITLGNLMLCMVDEAPTIAPGISAAMGSLALDSITSIGYRKAGPLDTDWIIVGGIAAFYNLVNTPTRMHTFSGIAVAGGAGLASVYLTSDGLTKSGSNSFLYTTLHNVYASSPGVGAADASYFQQGYDYNVSTGLLRVQFASANSAILAILIGLKLAPNGTIVNISTIGQAG